MQEGARLTRNELANVESIIFKLYKVHEDVNISEHESETKFKLDQFELIGVSGLSNELQVSKRFRVETGNYVIIPSMLNANKNLGFLLLVFTESKINISR